MHCPACGTENSDRARYCNGCGSRLLGSATDSGSSLDDTHGSQRGPSAGEVDTFGGVLWSNELLVWQIGMACFFLLLTFGGIALFYGLSSPNVSMAFLGISFIGGGVVILIALRRVPGASSFSRALLGPYRLGESEAQEVRDMYEKTTRRPPRR